MSAAAEACPPTFRRLPPLIIGQPSAAAGGDVQQARCHPAPPLAAACGGSLVACTRCWQAWCWLLCCAEARCCKRSARRGRGQAGLGRQAGAGMPADKLYNSGARQAVRRQLGAVQAAALLCAAAAHPRRCSGGGACLGEFTPRRSPQLFEPAAPLSPCCRRLGWLRAAVPAPNVGGGARRASWTHMRAAKRPACTAPTSVEHAWSQEPPHRSARHVGQEWHRAQAYVRQAASSSVAGTSCAGHTCRARSGGSPSRQSRSLAHASGWAQGLEGQNASRSLLYSQGGSLPAR